MTVRLSSKLSIPHPHAPDDCFIIGLLEQSEPNRPTNGRKLALILHGAAGHKDYLFQKLLAQRLPMDSFRFDFRGSHETPGTWRQGSLAEDVEDLCAVVQYLKINYGYIVDLVVGHSRGSLIAMRWICTTEDGKGITGFVNVSARYRMDKIWDGPIAKKWKESFAQRGYYLWTPIVARKPLEVKIYPEDVEAFAAWDTRLVWDKFPQSIDVLTLHGLSDEKVPPYDAFIYAKALSGRSPGTHSLQLVEDADHNFTGRKEEVVDTILDWWDAQREGALRTGVWNAGVRGKL